MMSKSRLVSLEISSLFSASSLEISSKPSTIDILKSRTASADLTADTEGEVKVRIDGRYLGEALRACGGMVEFKLSNAYSPMLFSANGYQLVVMPMLTSEADKQAKADREAKAKQAEPEAEPEATENEPVAEKPKKARRSRKREPVTV